VGDWVDLRQNREATPVASPHHGNRNAGWRRRAALIAYGFGEFDQFTWDTVSWRSLVAWTYLTVIGPIAFVAYAWLLRVAPIPLVATYSYVNPLVALVLGYALGNEILTPRILLAAGLIIGSVVLVNRRVR
jgi:drug/metabolite transporter (DMT)-like permease